MKKLIDIFLVQTTFIKFGSIYRDLTFHFGGSSKRTIFDFMSGNWFYEKIISKAVGKSLYPTSRAEMTYILMDKFFPLNINKKPEIAYADEILKFTTTNKGNVIFTCAHQGRVCLTEYINRIDVSCIRPVANTKKFNSELRRMGIQEHQQLAIHKGLFSIIKGFRLLKEYQSILVAIDHSGGDNQGYNYISPNIFNLAAKKKIPTSFLYAHVTEKGKIEVKNSDIKFRKNADAAAEEFKQFLVSFDDRYSSHEIRKPSL
jgi:hypothetical protein